MIEMPDSNGKREIDTYILNIGICMGLNAIVNTHEALRSEL